MKVKLNNGRFPEDGSVIVTLPVETEEYDQVIRQLDRLGVGSACLRDCGFEALLEGPDDRLFFEQEHQQQMGGMS